MRKMIGATGECSLWKTLNISDTLMTSSTLLLMHLFNNALLNPSAIE
jgi:hypothetical protein